MIVRANYGDNSMAILEGVLNGLAGTPAPVVAPPVNYIPYIIAGVCVLGGLLVLKK